MKGRENMKKVTLITISVFLSFFLSFFINDIDVKAEEKSILVYNSPSFGSYFEISETETEWIYIYGSSKTRATISKALYPFIAIGHKLDANYLNYSVYFSSEKLKIDYQNSYMYFSQATDSVKLAYLSFGYSSYYSTKFLFYTYIPGYFSTQVDFSNYDIFDKNGVIIHKSNYGPSIEFGIVDSETEVINGTTYYKSKTVRLTLQGKDNSKYFYEYSIDNGENWNTFLLTQKDYMDLKFSYNATILARIKNREDNSTIGDFTLTLSGISETGLQNEYETISLKGKQGIVLYSIKRTQDIFTKMYLENANLNITKYSNGKVIKQDREVKSDFQLSVGNDEHNYYVIQNINTTVDSNIKIPKGFFEYYYLEDSLTSSTITNPNTGEPETLPSIFDTERYYQDHGNNGNDDDEHNWLIKILKYVFVPNFKGFDKLVKTFNQKFGIFTQFKTILVDLFDVNNDSNPPEFKMTLWGTTVNIADFSAFAVVREFLQVLVLGFAWFGFLLRTYKRAPALIGGYFNFASGMEIEEKGKKR